jgi:hypothetical protein
MEQVCFIISSALNAVSEFLILKLDKNLIERVLELYRFSLDVRGVGRLSLSEEKQET